MLPQIPQDKANHYIYGLILAALFGSNVSPAGGLMFSIWMGLVKEMVDRFDDRPTTSSFVDFLATALGGLTYYLIVITA